MKSFFFWQNLGKLKHLQKSSIHTKLDDIIKKMTKASFMKSKSTTNVGLPAGQVSSSYDLSFMRYRIK